VVDVEHGGSDNVLERAGVGDGGEETLLFLQHVVGEVSQLPAGII